jgi:hypothetical protein
MPTPLAHAVRTASRLGRVQIATIELNDHACVPQGALPRRSVLSLHRDLRSSRNDLSKSTFHLAIREAAEQSYSPQSHRLTCGMAV